MSTSIEFDRVYQGADAMRAEFVRHVTMPQDQVEAVIGTMLLNGAVLLEGAPGLGKTETGKTLAGMIGGRFDRVQGTPDTQPTDIIGVRVYNPQTRSFEFEEGPIFSEVTLLDEINRLSPKAGAAFLQAMGEKEVTVGRETFSTGNVVTIATQNPHEIASGTYPLNVAQKDRFTAGIVLPALTAGQVIAIAKKEDNKGKVDEVTSVDDLKILRRDIVTATSLPGEVELLGTAIRDELARSNDIDPQNSSIGGARSYMDMKALARIFAIFRKGQTVSADDMRKAALYALPHRLELTMQTSIADRDLTAVDIVNKVTKSVR